MFSAFVRSMGYQGSCDTCQTFIAYEKILFSWIHSVNIQTFAWLLRCWLLSMSKCLLQSFGIQTCVEMVVSATVHEFNCNFFLNCRWFWQLYHFSRTLYVHDWFLCLSICFFFCQALGCPAVKVSAGFPQCFIGYLGWGLRGSFHLHIFLQD